MTPFSQPAAAYTPPPPFPAAASILPRSDRFLASRHPPTPPPARNNGHNEHSSSTDSTTTTATASIPSSSTTTTASAMSTQCVTLSNTQSSTPITTLTSKTDVCRDQRLGTNDNNEKEVRPSQKQEQRQPTQDLCQEKQGPCTFLPSFSSKRPRTLSSSTSTLTPTSTPTLTPDSRIYSTYPSRPVHMYNPHLSQLSPTQQQQLQGQHSLSHAHKKDAPHYYTSHQQHLLSHHLPYAPSAHQHQQQHPSLVSLQREPSLGSFSSREQGQVGSAQPNIGLIRSPDPRYLEAFEGYFGDHSHSSPQLEEAVAMMGLQSGEETASGDEDGDEDGEEEEEPKVRWAVSYKPVRDGLRKDRRRSRSVSGVVSPPASPTSSPPWTSPPGRDPYDGLATPMSRASSFLVSPATDGTVTTPPPSSRVSYSPRRRHHSCVAPNTKEFQTLATIFGWVTDASANYPRPIRSEEEGQDQEEEGERGSSIESIIMEGAPRYLPGSQSTVCASDDDSDLDDCFRQSSSSASWRTSRESRDSELSQTRVEGRFEHNPHNSNGSIEFLNESGEAVVTGYTAISWSSFSKSSSRNNWQTGTPESESASSSSSSSTSTPPHLQSMDDLLHDIHRRPSAIHHQHQHHSFPVQSSDALSSELLSSSLLPQTATGLHRSDTMSTRHSCESLSSPLESEQLESPLTQCSNSTLMSPLSSSHDKDSGYISFSYNKHGPSLESFARGVALRLSEQRYNRAEDASGKTVQAAGAVDPTATSEDTEEPPAPPPIPPRYPEIDLRVFDRPEEESCETIVYAPPLEGSKRESLSGTLELRPIIAATIVKLIEKLTHQYGLDSGFIADFFLTYRLFMSPVQLCKYLIQRYLWALEEDTEFRCVIRVRTFVVFKFWINNHFADDFLTSKSLRFQMASFLNEMRFNARVQASPRDSRIIRNLMEFFKYQRRYYKGLAQQSATAEMERDHRQHMYNNRKDPGQVSDNGDVRKSSTDGTTESTAAAVASSSSDVVDRLRVSIVHRQVDPVTGKVTTSDVTETANAPSNPAKGRHRAYTLGGLIIKPLSGDTPSKHVNTKPPLFKEQPRTAQQMGRQPSEGSGPFQPRERRLSSSSIKSNRSTSTWSTKFVNKIRQKSEDFYQQIVHPSGATHKADSKQCVCWTLAYIGISEQHHHTLSSARSFPNLRPSVISTHYQQQQDTAGSVVASNTSSSIPSLPSNKSIKRLKSSLSLGLHSSTSSTVPSPVPSPTRNQFSGISNRHSRSNSNSSVGYHPNPECPYHIPCVEAIQTDSTNAPPPPSETSESGASSATFTTLKEALQEDFASTTNGSESGSSSQPQSGGIVPPSPGWNYGPWHSSAQQLFPTLVSPPYKPFILFYRSQLIAQQLCLLEQHFLENVKWDELLEVELCRAGRKSRNKVQSSISGYLFRAEGESNGMDASNERSNMLCMWVASEVVSTRVLDDRVRVIEKFIRIAQKCYQYRNFNSLMQLVMGLGSSPLCGLRRTWARVGSYEMRVLQDLQDFISPFGNWSDLRKAMNQVGYQETSAAAAGSSSAAGESIGHQRLSVQGFDVFSSSIHATGQDANGTSSNIHTQTEPGHSKYLQYQAPLDRQGCIPFLGLFVFDLTHIAVSPSWFLPQVASSSSSSSPSPMNGSASDESNVTSVENGMGSAPSTPMKANHMATAARLEAPESKDLQELLPSGSLLVHFYRYQLIAKTIKWFMAFQQRSPKYTFSVDSTLYSKCFLLRVLTKERVKELAIKCESE